MKLFFQSQFAFAFVLAAVFSALAFAQDAVEEFKPLVYHDTESTGVGAGKHVVFLAGDHEYRSEESLPAIARLMAKHHGFKCTVLFNVDPDGHIKPGNHNMPGMEALDSADLAVVFLRFQDFPDDQMQHFADYLERGGPVVGLRTSTHAFKINKDKKFARFDFKYAGKEFEKGFGRQILGETWAGHYGKNHVMSTRHIIVKSAANHPVLRGVTNPWAQCGGYWTEPMPDSVVLTNSQALASMEKDAEPAEGKKPCPGCWVRTYKSKSGNEGRVFASTSGCSEDLLDDDFRRMIVNGCFWAAGMEDKITADMDVSFVGPYHPVTFGFNGYRQGVKPLDMAGWDTPIMDSTKPVEEKNRPKQSRRDRNKEKAKNSAELQQQAL